MGSIPTRGAKIGVYMDFIIKMNEAMTMIHEACKLNDEWVKCGKCPFIEYCNVIEEAGFNTPDSDEFLAGVAQR